MGKKKVSKKSSKTQPIVENVLPQNIMPIGERVEDNKNIYISQPVYNEIHKFTKNKTTNESGGVLVGNVVEEFGKINIIIHGFVEAKHCEATPTTLKFTHKTWEYCHKEIEKKFSGQKIVGWIHTHPDFGIFLSEYDKFIQENFFKEEYQIAYVVDPIQNIEGFYFWINGKIERCRGFYKFDKMGAKIATEDTVTSVEESDNKSVIDVRNIIIAILAICMVFLIFSNISQDKQISNLQRQQEIFTNNDNNINIYMQRQQEQISDLLSRVQTLEKQLETSSDSVSDKVTTGEGSSDVTVDENVLKDNESAEDKTTTGGNKNE